MTNPLPHLCKKTLETYNPVIRSSGIELQDYESLGDDWILDNSDIDFLLEHGYIDHADYSQSGP